MARNVSAARTLAGRRIVNRNFVGSYSNVGSTTSKVSVVSTAALNNLTATSIGFFFIAYSGGGGGNGRIFHKGPNNLGYLDVSLPTNGRLSFNADWLTTDQTSLIDTPLLFRRWYHAMITYSGVVGEAPIFYLNGAAVSSASTATSSGARATDSTSLTIGGWGPSAIRNFDGLLHTVELYNVVLTPTQIADRYFGGNRPNTLVEAWSCGDGSGTTLAATLDSLNNGTLSGGGFSTQAFSKTRTIAGTRTLA